MPIETHGFFTGGAAKIAEDFGHIVFGLLPLDLLWFAREHTTMKLPWPFKGQWPPGDIMYANGGTFVGAYGTIDEAMERLAKYDWPIECVPLKNVRDSARDELGRSIGAQLRPVLVASLTLWAVGWW